MTLREPVKVTAISDCKGNVFQQQEDGSWASVTAHGDRLVLRRIPPELPAVLLSVGDLSASAVDAIESALLAAEHRALREAAEALGELNTTAGWLQARADALKAQANWL